MTIKRLRADWMLVTALCFMVGAMSGLRVISPLLALAALASLVGWAIERRSGESVLPDNRLTPLALLAPLAVAVVTMSFVQRWVSIVGQGVVAVAVVAVVVVLMPRNLPYRTVVATGLLVTTVIGLGVVVGSETEGSTIDIILAHEEGADALRSFENPYEVVRFENTSPVDSEPFVGYPYPPVGLLTYVVPSIAVSPRVIGVAWVVVFAAVLAVSATSVGRFDSSFALSAMVVGSPAIWFMLFSGATEGFSAVAFLVSGLFWRRRPVVSAIALGLAIASKQYFVVPALALLIADVDLRWKRLGVAAAVGIATALPFFLWNPAALLEAFRVSGSWNLRPDAFSIGALGILLPSSVVSLAAVVSMVVVRKRFSGASSFFFVAGLGLTVMLVLHPHSFANHWFALLAILATAITVNWREPQEMGVRAADMTAVGSVGTASV